MPTATCSPLYLLVPAELPASGEGRIHDVIGHQEESLELGGEGRVESDPRDSSLALLQPETELPPLQNH